MTLPVPDENPVPYDGYLVWPCKNLNPEAEDTLERQVRETVGPHVKVTRETRATSMTVNSVRRVMFWHVADPNKEQLEQLEKLEGVKCLQKNELDEEDVG